MRPEPASARYSFAARDLRRSPTIEDCAEGAIQGEHGKGRMGREEQPTIKHLREQMTAFGAIFRINKLLRGIGLGSKKITEIEPQYEQMRQQLLEFTEYPRKFNEYFSDDGWLAHDSLNFDVLKRAVDVYETEGKDRAVTILLDHYGADQVAERLFFFNHVAELRVRRKFINFALAEHREGRHYSAIPLLLMVIDGAMNDALGKGFHASDITLDVWDSPMVADGAIYKIKEIFQKGRKKTRIEPIDIPYRNGILHGLDLGYDQPIVTAKSWCFLFVVRDWLVSKKSEAERRKAFQEETRVPSLRELAAKLADTSRLREAIEAWRPRSISPDYIKSVNNSSAAADGFPECVVLEFLAFWKKRNYGCMASLFSRKTAENPKTYAREVRQQFEQSAVERYSIKRIADKAPAISEIDVEISHGDDGSNATYWTFRLIRENEKGDPMPANLTGGRWQIVWIHKSIGGTGRRT